MMEKLTNFWWDMETGENLDETPEMKQLSKENERFYTLPARIEWTRWDLIKKETPEQ